MVQLLAYPKYHTSRVSQHKGYMNESHDHCPLWDSSFGIFILSIFYTFVVRIVLYRLSFIVLVIPSWYCDFAWTPVLSLSNLLFDSDIILV